MKAAAAHFVVTEVLEPRNDAVATATPGHGKHCYVKIRRQCMTTYEVRNVLGELFGVRPDEIGYAGLKDMRAVSTQTFSLPRDKLLPWELRRPDALAAIAARICSDARLQVIGEPGWHMSKLRIGELVGNHFDIIVSDCDVSPADAAKRAAAISAHLKGSGWPNYFGPQRFGRAGVEHALRRGIALLQGRMNGNNQRRHAHAGALANLMLASMQSALYNEYLAERLSRGIFDVVHVGDLVSQPHSATKPRLVRAATSEADITDGVLAPAETDELRAFAISHTGPMFGACMAAPGCTPAALEAEIWTRWLPGIPLSKLRRAVLRGSRRVNRLPLPSDLIIEEATADHGLRLRFSLPRGAYATSLIREFTRCDDDAALGEADEDGEVAADLAEESVRVDDDAHIEVQLVPTPPDSRGLRVTSDPPHLTRRALKEVAAYITKHVAGAATTRLHVTTLAAGRFAYLAFEDKNESQAMLEPVQVALSILRDSTHAKKQMPTVARLLPLQACCHADLAEVRSALAILLQSTWPRGAKTFAVVLRTRKRASAKDRCVVEKDEWVRGLAAEVGVAIPQAAVNLSSPEITVHVEVILEVAVCCLSVLPGWAATNEYRLQSTTKADDEEVSSGHTPSCGELGTRLADDGRQWVLEVPCSAVQQVLSELAACSWTPQRWHQGNRHGTVVWRGESEGTRLLWLTHDGAIQLRQAELASEQGTEGCEVVRGLLSSREASVCRHVHPQPELPFRSTHALVPLPASGSMASVLESVRRLAGVGDEQSFSFCELFAGIGGFRIGLEAIGGRCLLASEWDSACCRAYVHNFGEDAHLIAGDVHELDFAAYKGVDLLVGGFPCQPFSALGPQSGLADPRGLLFRQIERFLREAHPRAFLLENVPGLLTSEDGKSLEAVVSALRAAGYMVTWEVVSAAPVTPQRRRRLYFVGYRQNKAEPAAAQAADAFAFPEMPELNVFFGDVAESDDMDEGSLSSRQFDGLRSACSKRGLHSVLLWDEQKAAPIVSHYGHDVSAGASQLRPQAAPRRPRLFTPRECLRIMGFPEAFALPAEEDTAMAADSDSGLPKPSLLSEPARRRAAYRMIGNAVCPPVIAAIAGSVMTNLDVSAGASVSHGGNARPASLREAGIKAAVGLMRCALPAVQKEQQAA